MTTSLGKRVLPTLLFLVMLLYTICHAIDIYSGLSGSVGCASDWRSGGLGFDPGRGRQHSFVEIDNELFSPFR